MKVRINHLPHWIAVAALSTIMLVLVGCESSGPNPSANSNGNPNNPELFDIPQNQMSHVQVLTVEPTTLTRSLRLTGAVFRGDDDTKTSMTRQELNAIAKELNKYCGEPEKTGRIKKLESEPS